MLISRKMYKDCWILCEKDHIGQHNHFYLSLPTITHEPLQHPLTELVKRAKHSVNSNNNAWLLKMLWESGTWTEHSQRQKGRFKAQKAQNKMNMILLAPPSSSHLWFHWLHAGSTAPFPIHLRVHISPDVWLCKISTHCLVRYTWKTCVHVYPTMMMDCESIPAYVFMRVLRNYSLESWICFHLSDTVYIHQYPLKTETSKYSDCNFPSSVSDLLCVYCNSISILDDRQYYCPLKLNVGTAPHGCMHCMSWAPAQPISCICTFIKWSIVRL